MAITSLSQLIANMYQPRFLDLLLSSNTAQFNWSSSFFGNQTASAPVSGLNGEACDKNTSGAAAVPHINPASGEAVLARLSVAKGLGNLLLCDRLWQNSGLSVTSTAAQAISAPVAIAARDRDGSTNGKDVLAGVEFSALGGAGTPTITLTFTDQDGTTGRTATCVGRTTPPQGGMDIFDFTSPGAYGVRAPTSFIQSATRTSGTMHLVLFRVLTAIEFSVNGFKNFHDALSSGAVRIPNDACLFFMGTNSAGGSDRPKIEMQESHG